MRKPCRGDLQSPAGLNPSVLKAPDEVVGGGKGAASRFAETPGDQSKASLARTATDRETRVQARSEHGLIKEGCGAGRPPLHLGCMTVLIRVNTDTSAERR